MDESPCSRSFSDLEDVAYEAQTDSALGAWYARIRNISFGNLGHEAVARACRQDLFLDMLIPCILMRLQTNSIQGDLWMGQLADALTYVSEEYWDEHPSELRVFQHCLNKAWLATGDDDLDWTGATARRRRKAKQ